MNFIAQEYGRQYAPKPRETFRRQVLHQFVQARVADYNPDTPDLPTNSPRAHYAITEAALAVVRAYGTRRWRSAVNQFLSSQGSLLTVYQRSREQRLVPALLPDGTTLKLSPGKHNQLQAAVIAELTGKVDTYLTMEETAALDAAVKPLPKGSPATEETILALVTLGESRSDAERLVERAIVRTKQSGREPATAEILLAAVFEARGK